jgi:aminomethyltransferase
MENLKKTAAFNAYAQYGGKVVDYAGWALPVQFEGLVPEHHAVRKNAGLFDVSHMGEVTVKGPQAEEYVNNLITNDVSVLHNNQVAYSLMCYPDGGVVDDLLAYKYSTDNYLLVINAGNVEKDYQWMLDNKGDYDVELVNISKDVTQLAIQGPKAQETLQKLTSFDLSEIKFFHFNDSVEVNGAKCIVSRTGYTGEDGFEIYTTHDNAESLWHKILEAGKDLGVKPIGLGARDTLRFEATLPLYGNEIDKDITPLEAGLGYFVKLDKANFIGKDALVKQKAEGLKRKTVGFEMRDRGIPRHGYDVAVNGEVIGVVTTGYFSPTLEKNIGFALIKSEYADMGNQIDILIRNKPAKAEIVSRKFYTKQYTK